MRVALFAPGVVSFLVIAGCSAGDGPHSFGGTSFPGFGPGSSTTTTGSGGGPFGTYDQPVVVPARPTPALSGGTLLLIGQGHKAAVADPERDHVVFVDLDQLAVTATAPLAKGDEPGRLVEDAQGRVHVVLRGSVA